MSNKNIKFKVSPSIQFVTNVNLGFSEEQFTMNVFSGNQVYRFSFSPEHAKRIALLLEKNIEKYQGEYGELEAELPDKEKGSAQESKGEIGFNP